MFFFFFFSKLRQKNWLNSSSLILPILEFIFESILFQHARDGFKKKKKKNIFRK